jgi:ABC-type transport system involved in multi-copper enzyme maturation permease subunit
MWCWNIYVSPEAPRFGPGWIRLWWVLGFGGMMVHAMRDRDIIARRSYGFLGYALMLFGLMTAAIHLANQAESPALTGVIAGVLAFLVVIATAAPFVRAATENDDNPPLEAVTGAAVVQGALRAALGFFPRWWASLKTSSRVQQATLVGLVAAVVFVIAGYAVLKYNPLASAIGAILGGFLFLVAFTGTERDPSWRGVAVCVIGLVGALAALTGLGTVASDWIGLGEQVIPYGFFAALGLMFLSVFVVKQGTESSAGYTTAVALTGLGLIVLLVALLRGFVPALAYPTSALQVPSGFILVTTCAAFALVGAGLVSDNVLLTLIRRELAAYFYSPVAYIVIAGMGIMAWFAFWWVFLPNLFDFRTGEPRALQEPILQGYFFALFPVLCLILFGPALTMRLLSEEQRTGTIEVLLTAPLGEVLVVLSKFLACWIFFMLTWSVWAVFPIAFRIMGKEEFDYRPLLSFFVMISFMASSFVSMGLFFSGLTRNQIVAFILTAAAMIVLTAVAWPMWMAEASAASDTKQRALRLVSYLHHIEEAGLGKIHLEYLVFHLSVTVFWLFSTVKVLEARKWR